MNSINLDNWWDTEYPRYSIKNYESNPFFIKFFAISTPYELNFADIEEKYTSSSNLCALEMQAHKLGTGIKVGVVNEEKRYHFLTEFFQDSLSKVIKNSNLGDDFESGEIRTIYSTHEDKVTWKCFKDFELINEYSNSEKTIEINDCFQYELEKTGKKVSNKGEIDYVETTIKNYFSFYKNFRYTRGTKNSSKEETHYSNKIKYKSNSTNINYEKNKKVLIKQNFQFGTLRKRKSDELFIKKWTTDTDYSYEEIREEKPNIIKGTVEKVVCKDRYEIKWEMKDKMFTSVTTGFKNGRKWEKKVKKINLIHIEMIDFEEVEEKKRWGIIKDNSCGASIKVEWIGKRPELYDIYKEKVLNKQTYDGIESETLDIEDCIIEVKEDAIFMFETIQNLVAFYFPLYASIRETKFNTNTLRLQGLDVDSFKAEQNPNQINQIYNTLSMSSRSTISLLENKNSIEFFNMLSLYQKENNANIDLNQLFYELKHFDYILKEIQVLKNKLYEPKLSPELFDTFNVARLDFQKHYYIKTQLMDALRKIKPEQGEVSSSQEVIIQKIVNNVYETEEFQIFCFNCCNVCHKSCQLSDSSASDRKFLKKCASMIQNEKKCGVCIRKCSYKSHYRINKIIVQEVESYSIEPTETQIKEAIQLEENEIGKIIQDINQASLVPYFIVELQRIVSLTFSNLEDCEENKLKEIFKMEMSALSGFRYLLATS